MDLRAFPDLTQSLSSVATGAGGLLNAAKVHLTKQAVELSDETTVADLDAAKADYAGYVPKSVTWLAPSISDAGVPEQVGTVPEFRPTDNSVDNLVYQVYVTDAAGTKLLLAGPVAPDSIPMADVTDALLITLRFSTGALATTVVVS